MQLTTPTILVFLGPQGSGKGTQSIRIAELLQLQRAEAGQLCRDEAKKDTELGRAVKAILEKGEYLPIKLWKPIIERVFQSTDVSKGMVFDGFLRTTDQLAVFQEFRQTYQLPDVLIVYLRLSKHHAVERLMKRGRADDTPELIARRLEWSIAQVQEILEHYRAEDKVIDIDADQPIETVQQFILDALKQRGIIQ